MGVANTVGATYNGKELVYQVICSECFCDLGTMTADTIQRALIAKGEVICPTCRSFKCRRCGYVVTDETERGQMCDNQLCHGCVSYWLQNYEDHGLGVDEFFAWVDASHDARVLG